MIRVVSKDVNIAYFHIYTISERFKVSLLDTDDCRIEDYYIREIADFPKSINVAGVNTERNTATYIGLYEILGKRIQVKDYTVLYDGVCVFDLKFGNTIRGYADSEHKIPVLEMHRDAFVVSSDFSIQYADILGDYLVLGLRYVVLKTGLNSHTTVLMKLLFKDGVLQCVYDIPISRKGSILKVDVFEPYGIDKNLRARLRLIGEV